MAYRMSNGDRTVTLTCDKPGCRASIRTTASNQSDATRQAWSEAISEGWRSTSEKHYCKDHHR